MTLITTILILLAVFMLVQWAAPTPSVRVAPTGKPLGNGWQTNITFSLNTAINLWEQEVTPFGLDSGEPIDTTTQLNNAVVTKHPNRLYDLTDGEATCAYDPKVLNEIKSIIGQASSGATAGVITYHFPDGSTWCAYGYLRSFKPQSLVNKKRPMATVVATHTNWDPINCVEAAPVYTAGSGSCF